MIVKTQDLLLEDIDGKIAAWIDDGITDAGDLAQIVDTVVSKNIHAISVPIATNKKIWPWIENKGIRIFNRINFVVDGDIDDAVSVFAKNVMRAFKTGADGIQVCMQCKELENFIDAIAPIRDDLFFDHHFSVGINIDERGGIDWEYVFDVIGRARANSLLIMVRGDSFDAKSDFIGRVYGMFENWKLNADLHLMFDKNMMRVTQVVRLAQKMRPELVKNLNVFVNV